MFMLTSMPVGGAETLLCNLMRRMDTSKFVPELCCLKELGPLGEELASEFTSNSELIHGKFDLTVVPRLVRLMKNRVDALVTVGAGDKMFWGRIAARLAGVPVVLSALHSTGWPDGVGRLNRLLTPWTDGFIAVAEEHGRYLIENEQFPSDKVHIIANGIDTDRFVPDRRAATEVRAELGLPSTTPLIGIVAALRSEKNHELFVHMAGHVANVFPHAHFVIIGDGPQRASIEALINKRKLDDQFHLLGSRSDIPRLVAALDVFCLSSHNEANPVSILEALSCQVPVVATDVGSIASTVIPRQTGFLVEPGDTRQFANSVLELLKAPALAARLGGGGRERVIARGSLQNMVKGYEQLITKIYQHKQSDVL